MNGLISGLEELLKPTASAASEKPDDAGALRAAMDAAIEARAGQIEAGEAYPAVKVVRRKKGQAFGRRGA